MRPQRITDFFKTLTVWLFLSGLAQAADLPYARDLQNWGEKAAKEARPIVVVIVREDCAFCRLLEEEVIWPMIRSGDYLPHISLGLIDLDDSELIRDFDGKMKSTTTFANQYDVWLTPTVMFLGPEGEALEKPLVGTRLIDYYWFDLDEAIASGRKQLAEKY
ncbi:MAG: thioredoxin fold domain-containing protein [Gammaproteobacteria bacterium]|nr:thioredoxin fold domain-containing protein [Gammaproteobacteria bacterium]